MDRQRTDIRDERFWLGAEGVERDRARMVSVPQLAVDEESVKRALTEYLNLSPGVLRGLEAAESGFPRPRHPRPLARLLMTWIRFVLAIERGYPFGGEDYSNDLDSRDLLERLMVLVPAIRAAATEILGPWDTRFWKATRPSVEPLGKWRAYRAGTISPDGAGWWYFREPLAWPATDNPES